MMYLIVIGATTALLAGFLTLTAQEVRSGVRVLAIPRRWMDRRVARVLFIVKHVDWSAFLAHLVHTIATQVAHDLAHGTLLIVRALERTLTRVVRTFRERRQALTPEQLLAESEVHPVQRMTDRLRQMVRTTRRPRVSAKEESRATTDKS